MSRTLLLADGSITIQRVVELTFAHENVRVISVGDGRKAQQLLENERPDVVLVDVDLPEVDGYTLAAHIRRIPRLKDVPILLLAGAFEPVNNDRAREVGSDGVIIKPFEPQVVVTRVKELIDQKDRMSKPVGKAEQPAPPEPVAATIGARGSLAADPAPEPPKPSREGSAFLRVAPREAAAAESEAPALETLELPTRPIWDNSGAGGTAPSLSLGPSFPAPQPLSSHGTLPPVAPVAPAQPAPKVTLASAFTALLAAEQSSQPAGVPATTLNEASVEDAVRRVLVRMTDDLVRRIVVDTAERLIREEIERIKANPD